MEEKHYRFKMKVSNRVDDIQGPIDKVQVSKDFSYGAEDCGGIE